MKKTLILLVLIILLLSCKKGYTEYQMRILIKNETDSSMTVQLFPKKLYSRYGKYSYSDLHTKYKDTSFIPDKKIGTELFSTDTLDMDPNRLISRVFDSIHIRLKSGRKLSFTQHRTINHHLNPFTDKSAWIYQKNSMEYVRMWRDNLIETEDYIFKISSLE